MSVICNCGYPNATGAKRCRQCGVSLEGIAATGAESDERTIVITQRPPASKGPALRPARIDFRPPVCGLEKLREPLVAVSLWFPKIAMEALLTEINVRLQNNTGRSIDNLEVTLRSNGFVSPLQQRIPKVAPSNIVPVQFQPELGSAGVYALQCAVEFEHNGRRVMLVGTRTFWINSSASLPTGGFQIDRFAVNSDIGTIPDSPDGMVTPKLLSAERDTWKLQADGTSLRDLRKFVLEEIYQPVALSYAPAIPESFLTRGEAGAVLRLVPETEGVQRPIFVVGRREFKIGRSREKPGVKDWSDMVLQFLPETMQNNLKTKALGKLQVVALCQDQGIFFKNFKKDYTSYINEQPLGDGVVRLEPTGRTFLTLCEYELEVLRFPGWADGKFSVSNIANWKNAAPKPEKEASLGGAVAFRPVDRQLPFHDAVWMLGSAAFGSDAARCPVVIAGAAPLQGYFHYRQGCFWVRSLVAKQPMLVNGAVAAMDQIFPLSGGDVVTIGQTAFKVEIGKE